MNLLSKKSWIQRGGIALLLLGLWGCSEVPIYQDLTENEANEILVTLQDRGIVAEKKLSEKSQQVTWTVQVSKKDAAPARKILVENNLPHKRQTGSEICGKEVMIPTPEQEKCKRIFVKKGDIINSLERIPGVIDADLVLNIPDVNEFAAESQPSKRPSASVAIRVRKTPEGLDLTEPKLQRFVSNAVENMDPRDVSVVITYLPVPEEPSKKSPVNSKLVSIAGLNMDNTSKDNFKIYALTVLFFLIGISVALVFSLLKMTKLRRQLKMFRLGGAASGGEQDPRMLQGPEGGAMAPQIPAAGQTLPKS